MRRYGLKAARSVTRRTAPQSRFLLNRRESRFLCLQCHGDPHSQQDQVAVPHSRFGFQARGDCTRCHAAIHGSNSNQFFLQ